MPEAPDMTIKVDTSELGPILAADPANQAVIPAAGSTEYERTVAGGWWSGFLIVTGIILEAGSIIVDMVTQIDARAGKWTGAVLAIVGIIYRGLVDRAYIQGRSQIKAATATGAAQVAVAKITGAAPASDSTVTTTTTETGPPAP